MWCNWNVCTSNAMYIMPFRIFFLVLLLKEYVSIPLMGRYLLQLCDRVDARFLLMVSVSKGSDQALSMMSFLPAVLTQHNFLLTQHSSQSTTSRRKTGRGGGRSNEKQQNSTITLVFLPQHCLLRNFERNLH